MTQTIARPRAASRSRFATAPVLATAPDARTQIAREASDALTSGKSSIAESLCRTGLAIGPDAELERLLGVAVQQQGRSPEALACLTRALALASEGSRTWTESAYAKGRVHFALGQTADSVTAFKLALKHDGDNAEYHRRRGLAFAAPTTTPAPSEAGGDGAERRRDQNADANTATKSDCRCGLAGLKSRQGTATEAAVAGAVARRALVFRAARVRRFGRAQAVKRLAPPRPPRDRL